MYLPDNQIVYIKKRKEKIINCDKIKNLFFINGLQTHLTGATTTEEKD